jgi:hypothetical protein
MRQLHVATREEWREWLAENHGKEEAGIWLVFYRKETGSSLPKGRRRDRNV